MRAHFRIGGGRVSSSRLAAIIVVGLIGTACANAPQDRARPGQATDVTPTADATSTDCAALWTSVRDSAVASGVADGEARRLADQARVECEQAKGGAPVTGADELTDAPCGKELDAKNAAAPKGDPKTVGVYLSCKADFALVGTPQQPVYLAMREIPASLTGSEAERLEGAVRAYMAGPTPEEQSRGYFSAAPTSMAATIEDVSISGSSATINFSPDVADHIGNLTAGTAGQVFVIELGATVFQFAGIDQLTLQVEGDCERFWHLMERTCSVIERQG